MSRYGIRKYSTTKYGATAASSTLAWALEVDWNGDGLYDTYQAALTCQSLRVTRGRRDFLNQDNTGFAPVEEGRLNVTAYDPNRMYDPYNASSPLYPNVRPGAKFRLRVKDNLTGTIYNVMIGDITDVRPNADEQTVTITGEDRWRWLAKAPVNHTLGKSMLTGVAISHILTEIGWTDGFTLAGGDTLGFWWPDPSLSARANIQAVADAELGAVFIANNGYLKRYTRSHAAASAFTLAGADVQRNIEISMPWETVKNSFDVKVRYRKQDTSASVVWSLDEPFYMAAGVGSVNLYTRHQDSSQNDAPADAFIEPLVITTDYTANANADGSGADRSASLTVATTTDTYALSRLIIVTNSSAFNFYITKLQLRGHPAYSVNSLTLKSEDTASQALYGRQLIQIDSPFIQTIAQAQALLTWMESYFSSPKKVARVRLTNNPANQFGVDLFDRIDLDITDLALTGTYQIAEIEHEWMEPGGNNVMTTFRLEPV